MAADSTIFELPDLPAGAPSAELWEAVFYEGGPEGTYRRKADPAQQASTTFTNVVRGGMKLVRYLDSRLTGVPAGATCLDTVAQESLALGTEAWVLNPSPTPAGATAAPKKYVLLPVVPGTAGAVTAYVDGQPGTTATAPGVWQELLLGGSNLTEERVLQLAASLYQPYAASGNRPDLPNLKAFQAYVLGQLGNLGLSQATPAPSAPTQWQTDDVANTGSFKPTAGFTTPADYELQIVGQTTAVADLPAGSYLQTGRIVVPGFVGDYPTGSVLVRVKASGARPASDWLPSNAAFTSTLGAGPVPTIASFSPASGKAGDTVIVLGSGFIAGATAVRFGTLSAASVVVISATQLQAVAPANVATAQLTATTANGTATSSTVFTVTVTTPVETKAVKPEFGIIDDVNNTVSLTSQYSYEKVRWGIEGQPAQALASNSICSPGNIAARLYAYVIGDAASNLLQSDNAYSAPFSLAPTANNTPSVVLTIAGNSSVAVGANVVLQAVGTDADGAQDIAKIEYLDNGVKLPGGETSGDTGSLQSPALTAGTHRFTVKVTDSKGATAFSNAVLITAGNTAPTSAEVNLIIEGHSMAANPNNYSDWQGPTVAKANANFSSNSYPNRITSVVNVAYSGDRLLGGSSGMSAQYDSQVKPAFVEGKINVLAFYALTNELSNQVYIDQTPGAGSMATYVAARDYVRKAKLDHPSLYVIGEFLCPRVNAGTPQPAFENERVKLNQLIEDGMKSGDFPIDAIAPTGRDTRKLVPGPPGGVYYFDEVHPTQQSNDVIEGRYWADAITHAVQPSFPAPVAFVGSVVTNLYLPNALKLIIAAQTGGIVQNPANSGIYLVGGGGYGDWSRAGLLNLKMPANSASKAGSKTPGIDALNVIWGITFTNVVATGQNVYEQFEASFYRHEDGRIRYKLKGESEYTVGPLMATGEWPLFAKSAAGELTVVSTTDGITFTTLATFAGNFAQDCFLQIAVEASLGKCFAPQGFGLTAAGAPSGGAVAGTIITYFDSPSRIYNGPGDFNPDAGPVYTNGNGLYTGIINAYIADGKPANIVEVWGPKGPVFGSFQVQLNSVIQPDLVSQYAPQSQATQLLATYSGLGGGQVLITCQNKGGGGANIMAIDIIKFTV
jgi:hypothetical protein